MKINTFAFSALSLCQREKVVMYQKFKKTVEMLYLLDTSKGFDSVNNDILVNKLQDIGLSSSAIQWFRELLVKQVQAVRIDTVFPNPC